MSDNLTERQFGALTVIAPAIGYENENKMWLCECHCGRPGCKRRVIMRRGNLTRKTNWVLTCGANGNNAVQSAKTKLVNGIVQKNSRTGIPGVNHSCKYPGMYRARICVRGKRLTVDNLTLIEATERRAAWEEMVKSGIV